jgi:type IV pilus assembly protein PilO
MADNSLTKLPLAGQFGVSLLIAALIGGGFYYFWYKDALAEEAKKTARLEALQKEIRALEVTANKLQEFQREVQLLEAKLDTLKRILPPEKETPDLMRRVQSLAAQSFLTIRKFTPAAVQTKEFYQEVPINVDLDGTYHNLGSFFDKVSRLSRLVNVGNVKVKSQAKQSQSSTIFASCVATTFVYLDQAVPPPGAKRPGAPGAKKAPAPAR